MNLSPTVRWLLGGLAAGVTAFGALLPTLSGVPTGVGVAIAVVGAVLAALGIVPPQVGGTQRGVVNPDVVDVPPSDNIKTGLREAGMAAVELCAIVSAVCLVILVIIALD